MTSEADEFIQTHEIHDSTELRQSLMARLIDLDIPEIYYGVHSPVKKSKMLMRYATWFMRRMYNKYAIRTRSRSMGDHPTNR